MANGRVVKKPIDWVTLGPEPYLASCSHCGDHVPKPRLPLRLDLFVRVLDGAVAAHEACPPPVVAQEADDG